ncbi:MAG: hypothetical protein IKD46_05575 [Lentisphaeria bacterium]|nr:hypothetical protein [Lentisphaeria bacterium]
MCNMAAYAGKGQAAPVLLRMLEKQEGLWGGHFTGISTIHEGKVHTLRVCGDVAELLRKTDAEHLPGQVGIAHSRSMGNIPLETWAHPFPVGDGEVAYCGNGVAGIFAEKQNYNALAAELAGAGAEFLSANEQPSPPMPVLPDGRTVHCSEVNAHLLYRAHVAGAMDLQSALQQMFREVSSEITALALSSREPEQVSALRFNQPLTWACTSDAMLLASSAMAFPEDILMPPAVVPACSTLVMTAGGISCKPMTEFGSLMHHDEGAYRVSVLLDELLASGKSFTAVELSLAARKLWPPEKACCYTHLVYSYLRENLMNGNLVQLNETGKASLPGAVVPEWRFQKINKR